MGLCVSSKRRQKLFSAVMWKRLKYEKRGTLSWTFLLLFFLSLRFQFHVKCFYLNLTVVNVKTVLCCWCKYNSSFIKINTIKQLKSVFLLLLNINIQYFFCAKRQKVNNQMTCWEYSCISFRFNFTSSNYAFILKAAALIVKTRAGSSPVPVLNLTLVAVLLPLLALTLPYKPLNKTSLLVVIWY